MNSVYKWKFKDDNNKEYYAFLVNENGGDGFVYEANTRKRTIDGVHFDDGSTILDEQAIAAHTSNIAVLGNYLSKYHTVWNIAEQLKSGAMQSDGTQYFNLDFSSCGDVLNGGGLCPVMNFSYKHVEPGQGGVSITDSGTTNGINWYNVEIRVEKGEKGDKGDNGANGRDGEQGIQGEPGQNGEQGPQGLQGMSGKGRSIMAFCVVEKGTPESEIPIPEGGSYDTETGDIIWPEGWGSNNECFSGTTGGCDVWMTSAEFKIPESAATDSTIALPVRWNTPFKINGEDGELGKDGDFIQFIYYRTTDGSNDGKPDNLKKESELQPDDYIESGGVKYQKVWVDGEWVNNEYWHDHPSGIGEETLPGGVKVFYKIEYMSTRTRDNSVPDAEWGDWSEPSIWARWGENGIDGDGVEYIYAIGQNMEAKNTLGEIIDDINTLASGDTWNEPEIYDWIKENWPEERYSPWTDNPSDVSSREPYEFISVRRKKWDKELKIGYFDTFSPPTLWAKWASTPIIIDLSQESVGVGTGSDWQINVDDSGITMETEVYVQTNGTGSGCWFAEAPTAIPASQSDISRGVICHVEPIEESGDTYSKYKIFVFVPDLYTFVTKEHDIKIDITAKAQAFDGETAQTNLAYTIFAVQGGKEGSVITLVPSTTYVINDLVNGTFNPDLVSVLVQSNDGTAIEPLSLDYWIDENGPFELGSGNTIILSEESAITENAANIKFRAKLTEGRYIYCDVPVIPTGKSVARVQMSDETFIVGTDTDDILDTTGNTSSTTDMTLWYGNKICPVFETFVKKITVKYGNTKIGDVEKNGNTYVITNSGSGSYRIVDAGQKEHYLRGWIVKDLNGETGNGVKFYIPSGNSAQYWFEVGVKTELAENFEFEMTLGGIYGAVDCEASATYKVIGVRNGADGGVIYQLIGSNDTIKVNLTQSFTPSTIRLNVHRLEGDEETVLANSAGTVNYQYNDGGTPIACTTSGTNDFIWSAQLPNTAETISFVWDNGGSGTEQHTARFNVKIVRDSLGKMLYSEGLYDSTKSYEQTDATTPFVYYEDTATTANTGYYYLAKDSNVSGGTHYAPADNSGCWAKMEQYSAILTDTLVANYAKLGSAVFYREFMFSQQGRSGNTLSTDYKNFLLGCEEDEIVGTGSTPNTYSIFEIMQHSSFIPNYFINFLTGEKYGKSDYGVNRQIVIGAVMGVISSSSTMDYTLSENQDVYVIKTLSLDKNFYLTSNKSDVGRRVTIINAEPSNNNYVGDQRIAIIPSGNTYIYENGGRFSKIIISNESIELVGMGSFSNGFTGWAVMARNDISTNSKYGAPFKYLAHFNIGIRKDVSTSGSSTVTVYRPMFMNLDSGSGINWNQTFDGSPIKNSIDDTGSGSPYYECAYLSDNIVTASSSTLIYKLYLPQYWIKNGTSSDSLLSCILTPHGNFKAWISKEDTDGNWIEIGMEYGGMADNTYRVMDAIVYNYANLYSQNRSKIGDATFSISTENVIFDGVMIQPNNGVYEIAPLYNTSLTFKARGFNDKSKLNITGKFKTNSEQSWSDWNAMTWEVTEVSDSDGFYRFTALMPIFNEILGERNAYIELSAKKSETIDNREIYTDKRVVLHKVNFKVVSSFIFTQVTSPATYSNNEITVSSRMIGKTDFGIYYDTNIPSIEDNLVIVFTNTNDSRWITVTSIDYQNQTINIELGDYTSAFVLNRTSGDILIKYNNETIKKFKITQNFSNS